MKPTFLSLLSVMMVFSAVAQPAPTHAMPRRPSIILIVAKGLGAGDLSCYGQTQFQTPNLDKLAAQGMRLTHYAAGSTDSTLALGSLMIGKNIHPPGNTQPPFQIELGPNDITIARLLHDSGYFTSFVGEWDLGSQTSGGAPWEKGFDEFSGYFTAADAENAYADFIWRFEEPVPNDPGTAMNGSETVYANSSGKHVQYIPDWLVTLTLNISRNNKPNRLNHYQPYFLVLHCSIPGNGNRVVPSDAPFSEESWPQPEKNRAAMIARLDSYIGLLEDQLEAIKQLSNTVIFVTSDTVPRKTGGTDPKFFQENPSTNTLYAPMIVSWPGKIPAGQVSDRDCSARDFLPTVSDIGLVTPVNSDGVSFFPTLLGQTQK
jgi:arylsulfatase A-like enzyme